MMVDDNGTAYAFDGTAWAHSNVSPNFASVSCASANFCAAVGTEGVYVYSPTSGWRAPTAYPGPGVLQAISCLNATFCMGVDANGGAALFDGNSWSSVDQVVGSGSSGFSGDELIRSVAAGSS
jgi:hypothetical protein